jgi:hypothetical protein
LDYRKLSNIRITVIRLSKLLIIDGIIARKVKIIKWDINLISNFRISNILYRSNIRMLFNLSNLFILLIKLQNQIQRIDYI